MLTLPPVVGNKYLFRNTGEDDSDELLECKIIHEEGIHGTTEEMTYRSEALTHYRWIFWPDGKAKISPFGEHDHVAILVEDIPLSEDEKVKKLLMGREEMMQRLKEMGA